MESHLLVDQRAAILDHIFAAGQASLPAVQRIDLIADNAGQELLYDLSLVDRMLDQANVPAVQFHLKTHPTFVSDAMVKDVQETIGYLLEQPQVNGRELGARLNGYLEQGRLRLKDDPFWTSPLALWEMPYRLREDLAGSGLILIKGDANYRRMLGDRHWPYTTPLANIIRYLPAPTAALRVLKSEVAAGLQPGQPEKLQELDPDWLVNGKWGVIQFEALQKP